MKTIIIAATTALLAATAVAHADHVNLCAGDGIPIDQCPVGEVHEDTPAPVAVSECVTVDAASRRATYEGLTYRYTVRRGALVWRNGATPAIVRGLAVGAISTQSAYPGAREFRTCSEIVR